MLDSQALSYAMHIVSAEITTHTCVYRVVEKALCGTKLFLFHPTSLAIFAQPRRSARILHRTAFLLAERLWHTPRMLSIESGALSRQTYLSVCVEFLPKVSLIRFGEFLVGFVRTGSRFSASANGTRRDDSPNPRRPHFLDSTHCMLRACLAKSFGPLQVARHLLWVGNY